MNETSRSAYFDLKILFIDDYVFWKQQESISRNTKTLTL